jgi:hypothetical protein
VPKAQIPPGNAEKRRFAAVGQGVAPPAALAKARRKNDYANTRGKDQSCSAPETRAKKEQRAPADKGQKGTSNIRIYAAHEPPPQKRGGKTAKRPDLPPSNMRKTAPKPRAEGPRLNQKRILRFFLSAFFISRARRSTVSTTRKKPRGKKAREPAFMRCPFFHRFTSVFFYIISAQKVFNRIFPALFYAIARNEKCGPV